MLNDIEQVLDSDKSAYMLALQKDLDECAEILTEIQKRHEKFGFLFPNACHANFRDALFHYRKISELSEKNLILNQAYALREHLHRSIKDGIVNYMQLLSAKLECLYGLTDTYTDDEINSMVEKVEKEYLNSKNGILEIMNSMKKKGYPVEIIKSVFLYHYSKLATINKKQCLQSSMHKIKNICLQVRVESLLIERPFELKDVEVVNLLDEIMKELQTTKMDGYVLTCDILWE